VNKITGSIVPIEGFT